MMQFFACPKLLGFGPAATAGFARSAGSVKPPTATPPTRSNSRRSNDEEPHRLSMTRTPTWLGEPWGLSPRCLCGVLFWRAIDYHRVYHSSCWSRQRFPASLYRPFGSNAKPVRHPASTMRYLLALLIAPALTLVASAQGFVESVSPPVVERGKTTRVSFVGKDLGPGLDIWHSLPKGTLTAKPVSSEPGKLVFDITASADAPIGVCGLRLATRDGLTNTVLLHVDDLPVPGKIAQRNSVPLPLPACVWGTFREGTLDRYTITVAANER